MFCGVNAVCIVLISRVVYSVPCMTMGLIHVSLNSMSTEFQSQDAVVDVGSE